MKCNSSQQKEAPNLISAHINIYMNRPTHSYTVLHDYVCVLVVMVIWNQGVIH
jgi:predicted phage tail protein